MTKDGYVDGTAGNDLIDVNYRGDPNGDRIDNNDAILPGEGRQDDIVRAGDGNDTVRAGLGNDEIYGGNGSDTLDGGSGCDVIYGGGAPGSAPNLIVNGSFENVSGLTATGYGFVGNGAIPSWTTANPQSQIDIHTDNRGGINPTDGRAWLDLDASPGGIRVGQNVAGVTAGQSYLLEFDAGDLAGGGNLVNVYWGGQLVACINPVDGVMTHYTFNLVGGAGNGSNRLEFQAAGNSSDNLGASIDKVSLTSTAGADDGAADVLLGGSGDDLLYGLGGNDTIEGGNDDDTIFGGDDNDLAVGGDGADRISGDRGDDAIAGGAGADTLIGGDDRDTFQGGTAGDFVDGSEGGNDLDTLDLRGLGLVSIVYDPQNAENGTVTFLNANGVPTGSLTFRNIENILRDPQRDGYVDGTAANDVIDATYNGDPQGDRIDSNDAILPGEAPNDDIVRAGAGNDLINSGLGNDDIFGGTGNDRMNGGDGNDLMLGEAGDDTFFLTGTPGNDTVVGGETAETVGDTIDMGGLATPVTVTLTATEAGTILNSGGTATFSEIENFRLTAQDDVFNGGLAIGPLNVDGGAGNDSLTGGNGNDTLNGGAGNDSLSGGQGNDSLTGGDGRDTADGGNGDDVIDTQGSNPLNDYLVFPQIPVDPTPNDDRDLVFGGQGNDRITTGDDADTIDGGIGNDTIFGGLDADSITGGQGNDSIDAGLGSDTVDAGDGDDFINAGIDAFSDYANEPFGLFGGIQDPNPNDGRDLVSGGAGNDTIITGDDADTIFGGTGNDSVSAGIDDDYVEGNDGNDTISAGHGSDTVYGGIGDDSINGGTGFPQLDIPDATDPLPNNGIDLLYGGAGNDVILGEDDDDTLYGDADNDTLFGGIDEDTLFGGTENDALFGGDAADVLDGGFGDDSLDGGRGDDNFAADSGNDTMLGGDDQDTFTGNVIGDSIDGGEGGVDQDTLDLRGTGPKQIIYSSTNPENGVVNWLNAQGQVIGTTTFQNIENVIPCFTPGTSIATPRGECLVQDLKVGDKVITRDNGIQEIRWIGAKAMDYKALAAHPHLKPVLIQKGALGHGLPERDMMVSPNHRMLVANDRTSLYFEEHEVLVSAKHLVNNRGVHEVDSMGTSYIHFMFDQHQVVLANGAWTESFQPGDYTLKGMGNAQRNEIFDLFPELKTAEGLENYAAARKTLKKHEAQLLMR